MVVQISLTLVSTVTVGAGGAASITFSSIPATGKDLLVLYSGRDSAISDTSNFMAVSVNNSYSLLGIALFGSGSAATTASTSAVDFAYLPAATSTSNTFGVFSMYITNYTSSTGKSVSTDFVTENNATAARQGIHAGLYNNVTSPVTSIKLEQINGGTIAQYSTASLYIIS